MPLPIVRCLLLLSPRSTGLRSNKTARRLPCCASRLGCSRRQGRARDAMNSTSATLRQLLTIPVGAFKPAEIGALAGPCADDKERHIRRLWQLRRRLLRRLLLCLGAGNHTERRERQCGDEGCLGLVHGCPSLLRFPATKALA